VAVIPFYGSDRPDLFRIERASMDRPGRVTAALDEMLPGAGTVADIGAGDGFTAERLATRSRRIVAVEPSMEMMAAGGREQLWWVRGDAEHLPFADGALDAAYATWAYFFSRDWDPSRGIAELHRAVASGGALLVLYFGDAGERYSATTLTYRVGVFHAVSRGPAR
jgi:ubiquinone/menaquinone biosynthesis C-methylase UbiE